MIEYRGIEKAFDVPVLSGVSLQVETGEILALLGPSGTGKSVLLKTTNGLLVPDRGDVLVDGRSVYFGGRGAIDEVRRKIGYVFQYAALFDSLTVRENVALGLREPVARELGEAAVTRRVRRALEDVHLDADRLLDKLPSQLSGGMRKRVGLARAVVGAPQILLFDEPVTGLDPVTSAAVSRLIAETSARLRATAILVTHDVEGALELCHRVALLSRGRLRFLGTPRAFRECDDPLVRAFADRRAAAAASTVNALEEAG